MSQSQSDAAAMWESFVASAGLQNGQHQHAPLSMQLPSQPIEHYSQGFSTSLLQGQFGLQQLQDGQQHVYNALQPQQREQPSHTSINPRLLYQSSIQDFVNIQPQSHASHAPTIIDPALLADNVPAPMANNSPAHITNDAPAPLGNSGHNQHTHLSFPFSLQPVPSSSGSKVKMSPSGSPAPTVDKKPIPKAASRPRLVAEEPVSKVKRNELPTVTMSTIRALVLPAALKKSPGPADLFKHLRMRGEDLDEPPAFTPSPDQLREILIQLRDHAPGEYLSKLALSNRYLKVWTKWMRQSRKEPIKWEKVMVPLLQVLGRTEMSLETAKAADIPKLAKSILSAAQEQKLASANDVEEAFGKYSKFLLSVGKRLDAENAKGSQGGTAEKRKADQVSKGDVKVKEESSQGKRVAGSSSKSTAPVSKPVKSTNTNADMSFFDTPGPSTLAIKPKSKPPAKPIKSATAPASQAQFSVMKMVAKLRNENNAATLLTSEGDEEEMKPRYLPSGRLVRSVRWKPEAKLTEVKEFVPDPRDRPQRGAGTSAAAHELDKQEGASLARNNHRGDIDWYDPDPYLEEPADAPLMTEEVFAQMERERGALVAEYELDQDTPDPSENDVRIVASQDDNTRLMVPRASEVEPAVPIQSEGIGALLANLKNIPIQAPAPLSQLDPPSQPIVVPPYAIPPAPGYPPQLAFGGPSVAAQHSYYDSHGWQNPSPVVPVQNTSWHQPLALPNSLQYQEGHDHVDPRGNGKQNTNKKGGTVWQTEKKGTKTCSYWRDGDCRFGDKCMYAHSMDV